MTSETLDTHIRLQTERNCGGFIAPERITLRMLLPSETLALPYPTHQGDRADPRPRQRLRGITDRHTESLHGALVELRTERLVPSVEVEVRRVDLTPAFKLYLLNGDEALHGMYRVVERPLVLPDGEEIVALDALGVGATLTRHVKDRDPNSPGSVFVDSMQSWFDSVWDLLAERS
ncbi:hypothetical protein ACIQAC_27415 [Streptomyces sp. NPDC088387]|uniref:hypothetical protein n=1 Tax=Streptomyces sp. NPDC088387 TaxID=3365859 RepID=UPI00382C743C